ncbi:MAG TPA: hypothetical protein VGH54_28225 [Mycobacterium sp.]|uniref:hypothetical protein n=1 Tax=Mycobacterium sp. TaxID=1785 RepID=UPI002F3F7303
MSGVISPYGSSGLQPWQFTPETYGAKGNVKVITDAVMATGTAVLTSASQAQFTQADVLKYINVGTALGNYAPLFAQIISVQSPTQCTLSASATQNTTGTPGAIAFYGTDDTAAVQSAINAAYAYAAANSGYGQVFGSKPYMIAGAFQVGTAGQGNYQLNYGPITATTARQVTLDFAGPADTNSVMDFPQLVPQAAGFVLCSPRTDGTNNGTYGPAWILGGPVNGYGGEPGTFSNTMVRIEGLATFTPYNATMGGVSCFGLVGLDVISFSDQCAAVPPTGGPLPSMSSANNISNQYTGGLQMPCAGNQTLCSVDRFSCEGKCYGFMPSEWTHANYVHAQYCIGGIGLYSGNGVSMVHHAQIEMAQVENCSNVLIAVDNGVKRLDMNVGSESISAQFFDPSSLIQGRIVLRAQNSAGTYKTGGFMSGGSGGLGLEIINGMTAPGPIASPQAPAGLGSPWPNYYYVKAWVTVSATTITGLTITGANGVAVAQAVPSGAATYAFMLGAGASYTATGTGTLTHTVTPV